MSLAGCGIVTNYRPNLFLNPRRATTLPIRFDQPGQVMRQSHFLKKLEIILQVKEFPALFKSGDALKCSLSPSLTCVCVCINCVRYLTTHSVGLTRHTAAVQLPVVP